MARNAHMQYRWSRKTQATLPQAFQSPKMLLDTRLYTAPADPMFSKP